ncbi:LacI family DNA-binding transcriptional regulator [Spirochaetia bacterium 38H-sp]|uniref:LacI family DNA-binding transcriptional regulator n=1 Tax=Rarispira pelagica TaxID=3141764 RepID=A0ABU9U9V4_9SPIR
MAKRARLVDVAKLAGVSHTTVSWALKGDPRISPETRKKVMDAARKLNYHPNLLARALVNGRTNTLAIVASFFSSHFEMEVLKGIEQQLMDTGSELGVLLFTTRGSKKREEDIIADVIKSGRADGLITLNISLSVNLSSLACEYAFPVVLIEGKGRCADTIRIDNPGGSYAAVSALVKAGAKNIAIVSGEIHTEEPGRSPMERLIGARRSLRAHGYGFDKSQVFFIERYYFEEGYTLFPRILDAMPNVDGIFCAAGDMVALGLLAAMRDRGISVPEDVRLVGYDDIPASSLVSPTLTTVRYNMPRMGATAVDFISAALSGEKEKKHYIEPSVLIGRQSC